MKRRLSTIALSALAVVAVGGLTVLRSGLVAGAAWRHEYTPLTRNTYPVNGTFTNISVTDYYADVQFRVSRDGAVSVVTRDADSVEHTVEVVGGTLTISGDFGIRFQDNRLYKIDEWALRIQPERKTPSINPATTAR